MYKILIVDDEKMIRMGIKNSMPWDAIGIGEVYTAATAREALELAEAYHPEIIITDISMTGMTGLELIEQIRTDNETCRIIVLTGYDRFDYARQALKLRTQDFLLKPIDEQELKKCICRQVGELENLRKEREEAELVKRTRGFYQQTRLEMMMCELINGKKWGQQEEAEFFSQYPFSPDQEMRAGILLPDIPAADNSDTRLFRIWTIKSICMGVLDEKREGITFSDGGGWIILILFDKESGVGVEDRAGELIDLLESECNSKIRIVLGSSQKGFSNLNISYNDAVFILENEKKEPERIARVEWEEQRDHMFRETYGEFKRALLASVKDADLFMHVFERFLQSLESYNVSSHYAGRCLFELASAVYFTYIGETGDSVDDRLNVFLQSLNGMDRENSGRLATSFFQTLLTKERGDEYELIRKVKKLIQNDLSGDLSITSLGDKVYVTPNYLSRIFKRMTGEGCNEYIVKKRIEKAKFLLETTSLKAGEIAVMIGYHDINYFSLAFKKQTGVSPTRYRERAKSEK